MLCYFIPPPPIISMLMSNFNNNSFTTIRPLLLRREMCFFFFFRWSCEMASDSTEYTFFKDVVSYNTKGGLTILTKMDYLHHDIEREIRNSNSNYVNSFLFSNCNVVRACWRRRHIRDLFTTLDCRNALSAS